MDVNKLVSEVFSDVVECRRYLHKNPELGFKEVNTSNFIREELSKLDNVEFMASPCTSVIVKFDTKKPGKCVALRADIDALPINEDTDVEFKSVNENVMHACGHDVHTAMSLGVAKIVDKNLDKLTGSVIFVFQHAEEIPPGGALDIIDGGYIDQVDEIYGLHVNPFMPVGTIAFKDGAFCASGDSFDVEIIGKGGHGAMPDSAIDPIVTASQVILGLQTLVSRRTNPLHPPVMTVGYINSGKAKNVIPASATFGGTIRCVDRDVRTNIQPIFTQIVEGICSSTGATANITFKKGYTVGVNSSKEFNNHVAAAKNVLTDKQVIILKEPTTGSEDFSSYLEKFAGNFAFVGVKNPEIDAIYSVHHPKFKADENAMMIGMKVQMQLLIDQLGA